MQIGNFDRQIKIESKATIKNSFGEEEITWTEFETVYAEKVDKVNKEMFQANQLNSIVTTVFNIYYLEGIIAKMRLIDLDTNVIYEIDGLREIGYKDGLQLFTYTKDRFP